MLRDGDVELDADVILSTFWSRVGIIGELWGKIISTSPRQGHLATSLVVR
jgi:hypothetical protein